MAYGFMVSWSSIICACVLLKLLWCTQRSREQEITEYRPSKGTTRLPWSVSDLVRNLKSCTSPFIWGVANFLQISLKNPAYRRQRISPPMGIVVPRFFSAGIDKGAWKSTTYPVQWSQWAPNLPVQYDIYKQTKKPTV